MNQMYSRIFYFVSLIILCILAISFLYSDTYRLLSFDEIDYIKASLDPFFDTWLSRNTENFSQFVSLGLSKLGIIHNINGGLIPEMSDSFHLRHFHGVFPIFYLSIFSKISSSLDLARVYASLMIFCISYWALIIYIKSTDQIFYKNIWTNIALVIFCINPGVLESYSSFNFHVFSAILVLPYCYLLNKTLVKYHDHNIFGLGFITALFWTTLETSLVITVATIIYLFIFKRDIFIKRHVIVFFLGMLIGFILINPGIIFSLDLIKTILMHAYRIFIKGASEYGTSSTLPMLIGSLKYYLPILLLLVFSNIVLILNKRIRNKNKDFNILSPELVIGMSYLFFIMPFTLNPTYLLPAIMLLQLSIFKITASIKSDISISKALVVFCVLAVPVTYINMNKSTGIIKIFNKEKSDLKLDLEKISPYCSNLNTGLNNGDALMLSSDANLLNLHLEKNCFNFLILDYGGKRLLGRLDKKYTPIKELINRNDITYIALKKERGYQSNLKALNVNMNYIYTGNYFDLIQINH